MLIMKKTLCVAALSLLMSGVVMAQDGNKKQGKIMSWNFVEAQAGLDWTITNAKIDKLLMPMGGPFLRSLLHTCCWCASSCLWSAG
jgi:hypothetical protein